MTAEAQNFKMRAGEIKNLRFTVDNPEEIDFAGASAKWWADRSNPISGETASIVKDGLAVDTTDGVTTVVVPLDRADTLSLDGDYYHELLISRASPALAQTAAVGAMTVKRTIIRP